MRYCSAWKAERCGTVLAIGGFSNGIEIELIAPVTLVLG